MQRIPRVVFRELRVDRLRAAVLAMMRTAEGGAYGPDFTGFDRDFGALEAAVQQQLQKRLNEEHPELAGQTGGLIAAGEFASALLPSNRGKNRYSNVLPPERTRVTLLPQKIPKAPREEGGAAADGGVSSSSSEEEEEGDDYINANLVTGLDLLETDQADSDASDDASHRWELPQYIATQGPLEWTVGDFWRMVWERDVSVVIMLTKEIENGRVKCGHYWPEEGAPIKGERFDVEQVEVDDGEELITRVVAVTNKETGESRNVTQFMYTAWPDHGLPPSTTAYLELSRRADEANVTKAPLVVHCSAGIGRTGTFCTVHSTVELIMWKMKNQVRKLGRVVEPPTVDIPSTVVKLRLQRPGMIQTREQYMFCFLAIMEEAERLLAEHQFVPNEDADDDPTADGSLVEFEAPSDLESPSEGSESSSEAGDLVSAGDPGAAEAMDDSDPGTDTRDAEPDEPSTKEDGADGRSAEQAESSGAMNA